MQSKHKTQCQICWYHLLYAVCFVYVYLSSATISVKFKAKLLQQDNTTKTSFLNMLGTAQV